LGKKAFASTSNWQLKEEIKQYLFNRGVDEQKTILLIIDEGQKIPEFCLEILREFLNYETNDFKLLQIVIFAQKEFSAKVEAQQNFADRINLYHTLNPLNFQETRAMIRYRLDLASTDTMGAALFSLPAHWVVYKATRGYPRKIINLCHRIILTMIIQNRNKAGFFLTLSCVKRVFPEQAVSWKLAGAGILAAVLLSAAGTSTECGCRRAFI
jgi:general secretion pathway protein A